MLKGDCKYSELKSWFMENMETLPDTMLCEIGYYLDVKWTAKLLISVIDKKIFDLGPKANQSHNAKQAKNRLFTLYFHLQNKDNWNKSLPKQEIIE